MMLNCLVLIPFIVLMKMFATLENVVRSRMFLSESENMMLVVCKYACYSILVSLIFVLE